MWPWVFLGMDLKPSDAPATALMPVLGRIPTRCKTRYRRDMEPRDTPIGEFGDRRITIPGSMRYGGSIALASTPGFQFYDIMRLRSWLITTLLVGATQVVLSILLILQHDALYAELLRQRVAVIAQTTAGTFKPILSLGLPISTLRGGDQILARGVDIDPDILAIHAVNPSGIIAHSTGPKPATIADDVLAAMRLVGRDALGARNPRGDLCRCLAPANRGRAHVGRDHSEVPEHPPGPGVRGDHRHGDAKRGHRVCRVRHPGLWSDIPAARPAAEQALAILRDGAVPGDLPILQATDFAYMVNMDTARTLNRIPPFAFLQVAETVPE